MGGRLLPIGTTVPRLSAGEGGGFPNADEGLRQSPGGSSALESRRLGRGSSGQSFPAAKP